MKIKREVEKRDRLKSVPKLYYQNVEKCRIVSMKSSLQMQKYVVEYKHLKNCNFYHKF